MLRYQIFLWYSNIALQVKEKERVFPQSNMYIYSSVSFLSIEIMFRFEYYIKYQYHVFEKRIL